MKILFETVNGKEVLKEFENGTLAKNFIVKNKDKLSKAQIMESEALDLSDTQKKFVSRFEGNGQLIPYKGKKNRKWKTYESKGTIEKDKEYYIEEDASGKYEHGAVNVYEPVGKSLRFLFKMSKKHLDEWFIKSSNISEAKIMEGPLGSGGWTPKKAYHNFKKGHERFNNLQKMDKTKDSFGQNIFNYLTVIAGNVGKDMEMSNTFGVGRDEKGYYIFSDDYAYREFKDDEYENQERVVSPYSKKYKNKIYMPKLTKYIEKHESLPSNNQIYNYMKALIEKRYENNLNALKKKQPTSLTSKTDVEDF